MPKIRSSTEFLRAYFLYSSSLSFVPLMFSGFQFLFPINMQMSFSLLLHLSFSDVLSLDSYGQLSKLDYRIGGIFFLSSSRIISQSCISFLFFILFLQFNSSNQRLGLERGRKIMTDQWSLLTISALLSLFSLLFASFSRFGNFN